MKRVLGLPERRAPEWSAAPALSDGFDLVPAALILWLGSLARVIAGTVNGDAFQGEATLALLCVVLIPCWGMASWTRFQQDEKKARRPARSNATGLFTKS
jgi:hypothetical protein